MAQNVYISNILIYILNQIPHILMVVTSLCLTSIFFSFYSYFFDLSANDFGAAGATALAPALRFNASLIHLDVRGTPYQCTHVHTNVFKKYNHFQNKKNTRDRHVFSHVEIPVATRPRRMVFRRHHNVSSGRECEGTGCCGTVFPPSHVVRVASEKDWQTLHHILVYGRGIRENNTVSM